MIRVIMDPGCVEPHYSSGFVVFDEATYLESRTLIRDALLKNGDLTIIVKAVRIASWYGSLQNVGRIKIEKVSPHSLLSRVLQVDPLIIPFDDSEIVEMDLVNEVNKNPPSMVPRSPNDIEDWALAACLGRVWVESLASPEHFSNLCSQILASSNKAGRVKTDTLQRLAGKREAEWAKSPLGDLYGWLFKDQEENAFCIYALQIMKKYDDSIRKGIIREILKKVNEQDLSLISKYVYSLPSIRCNDTLPDKVKLSNLIEIKWKNVLKERLEHSKRELREHQEENLRTRFGQLIIQSLGKMSGDIEGELNALSSFIKDNASYFDDVMCNILEVEFAGYRENAQKLRGLIPPKFPTAPAPDWSWDRISSWAINEYLPYIRWATSSDRVDRLLESRINEYGDWLYSKYPKLKNEPLPLNYGTWTIIKKRVDEGYSVLWIIIDNLPWLHVDFVKEIFERFGFTVAPPTGICPMLSMLPSETKVSKKALVAGRLPYQIDSEYGYQPLFEAQSKACSIPSHSFIQDSELVSGTLQNMKITCCLINKLDTKSHRNDFDMEDAVKDDISRWVRYIREFVMRGIDRNGVAAKTLRIVISTDHGCCGLWHQSRGIKMPEGAKPDEEHSRFVLLTAEANLDKNWYYLDKEKFGLSTSIGVAKGYAFIGNRKPKGLVHGGMTPEETIIPFMEFSLEPISIKPIETVYVGEGLHLGTTTQDVTITIRNLNKYEVRNIFIDIPANDIKIEIESIPGMDSTDRRLPIIPSKDTMVINKENYAILTTYYRFTCLGDIIEGKTDTRIKIRRLMEGPSEAEKLLGLGSA